MPEIDINTIFTENLKRLINSNNMTRAEFAQKIDVSASTVSMWFSGKSSPRMDLLDKIADLFKIEVAELYVDRTKTNAAPITLAAHFDGNEYTEEDLEEIRQFAEFVKNRKK